MHGWPHSNCTLITLSGSSVEIHYKLTSFGIPTRALPITTTGELRLDYHREWLMGREIIESKLGNSIVADPWVQHKNRIGTSLGSGNFIVPHQIRSSAAFVQSSGQQERPPTGGNNICASLIEGGRFPPFVSASSTAMGTFLPLDFALHEHSVVCSRFKKKDLPLVETVAWMN
jgi:hypothetical protein